MGFSAEEGTKTVNSLLSRKRLIGLIGTALLIIVLIASYPADTDESESIAHQQKSSPQNKSQPEGKTIKLPKIGDTISTNQALELCKHFKLNYLVTRIQAERDNFESWEFDGASMLYDGAAAEIFNITHLTEIALRHDLKYAYGELGNDEERKQADLVFKQELIADGASVIVAGIMYRVVRMGGGSWTHTGFSWGFARK